MNPVRNQNEGTYRGGRREDNWDYGLSLSRRSLRVKPITNELSRRLKTIDKKKARTSTRQVFMNDES